MSEELPDQIQRWTAKRRVALVLSIVKGETSVVEAARKHGLTVAEVEEWKERFELGAENALRSRPRDEDALKDEQIKKLKQKIGDLVLDMDIMKCRSRNLIGQHPSAGFVLSDQALMRFSRASSFPSIQVAYGVRPSQRLPWC